MNTAELSVLCVSSCRPFVRIDLNEVEEQTTLRELDVLLPSGEAEKAVNIL